MGRMTMQLHGPPLSESPPPDDDYAWPSFTPDSSTPDDLLDAERAVLGGMLLDKQAVADVMATTLTGEDFYRPAHEVIYEAILDLYQAQAPIDAVTIGDRLTKAGLLRNAGGAPYLHGLISALPVPASAAYYAELVRERAALRRVVAAGVRVQQLGAASTGGDAEQIVAAALAEVTHVAERYTDFTLAPPSSWEPMDLANVDLDQVIEPQLLARSDGIHLLYEGAIHSVVGEPGSAKSWFGLWGAVQLIKTGQDVAMLDFEDRPGPVVRRLIDMGCSREQVFAHFRYIRPDTMLSTATHGHLERAIAGCRLTLLDGVTEAMTMHGLSLMDNEDVAKFLALLPRRIADIGSTVLQVDHVVKNADDRGRYGIGAQHKLAGIDGAQFKITVMENFGRGKRGRAKVTIDKDRHGGVEQHSFGISIAELVLDSTGPDPDTVGPLRVYLDPPDTSAIGPAGEFRPTKLMARISDYIGTVPGCSTKHIKDEVGGKDETRRDAIRALVSEGYVRVEAGPNRSTLHWSISPYSDTDVPPW